MSPLKKVSKGFLSIALLFFLLLFSLAIKEDKEQLSYFSEIAKSDTCIQNNFLNIETTIKNTLSIPLDSSILQKKETNLMLLNYFSKDSSTTCKISNYYVYDNLTNQKEKLTPLLLDSLSTVVIYKPSSHVTVKKYSFTNGLLKTKRIGFEMETKDYIQSFKFPENYEITEVVYD